MKIYIESKNSKAFQFITIDNKELADKIIGSINRSGLLRASYVCS